MKLNFQSTQYKMMKFKRNQLKKQQKPKQLKSTRANLLNPPPKSLNRDNSIKTK